MADLKIFTKNIEQSAIDQINNLVSLDAFADSKIRIMPDVHSGKGCVIGFTADLGDKVIPNIIGVDIGCGILCVDLGNVDIDLAELDNIIRENIPSGINVHNEMVDEASNFDFSRLYCYKKLKNKDNWLEKSLGTLGGGNHFIELDQDSEGNKYLTIHTGSRNLGKQVAEIYQEEAINYHSYKEEMRLEKENIIKILKEKHQEQEIEKELKKITEKYKDKTKIPKDLCYLEGELKDAYLHDMKICQEFAFKNREWIYGEIVSKIGLSLCVQDWFQCIHNYINFEDNIARKGAISAKVGEKVIIPINMRDGCIIGTGKGNEDWNYSAPHGAGRIMSRMKAREKISIEDYKASMAGIYTTSVDLSTIDEAPSAYKPMEEIINNIKDTVKIEKIIKPIYNFKASE